MHVFSLNREQQWEPKRHVEKILGKIADGDVTVACWEPGQISPYHCHPRATEIYFCFLGGGTMRTPTETVTVEPGGFVVHPTRRSTRIREWAGAHNAVPRTDILPCRIADTQRCPLLADMSECTAHLVQSRYCVSAETKCAFHFTNAIFPAGMAQSGHRRW